MSHMPLATSAGGGNFFEGDETRKKDARGAARASSGAGGVGVQSLGVQALGMQSLGMQSFAGLTSSLALSGVLSHKQISLLADCTQCMPPADTPNSFLSRPRLRAFLLIYRQALTHTCFLASPNTHGGASENRQASMLQSPLCRDLI
jgi:hypothetical protein